MKRQSERGTTLEAPGPKKIKLKLKTVKDDTTPEGINGASVSAEPISASSDAVPSSHQEDVGGSAPDTQDQMKKDKVTKEKKPAVSRGKARKIVESSPESADNEPKAASRSQQAAGSQGSAKSAHRTTAKTPLPPQTSESSVDSPLDTDIEMREAVKAENQSVVDFDAAQRSAARQKGDREGEGESKSVKHVGASTAISTSPIKSSKAIPRPAEKAAATPADRAKKGVKEMETPKRKPVATPGSTATKPINPARVTPGSAKPTAITKKKKESLAGSVKGSPTGTPSAASSPAPAASGSSLLKNTLMSLAKPPRAAEEVRMLLVG